MTIFKKLYRLKLLAIVVGATVWCFAQAGIANAQDPAPPVTVGPTGDFAVLSDAGPLSLGNHTLVLGTGASVAST